MQTPEIQTSIEINFSPLLRRYTLEEFWALPEREDHARYNLIGGFLFLVPHPHPPHGDVASRMNESLMRFVLNNNIEGHVYIPYEPIYVETEHATYLEPDLMYVSKESREKMGTVFTSAEIVFEFCSRRTIIYDHTTKADTYLALGVRELWLVDPFSATIEVRPRRQNRREAGVARLNVFTRPTCTVARARRVRGFCYGTVCGIGCGVKGSHRLHRY